MTNDELKELKASLMDRLPCMITKCKDMLCSCDERLHDYCVYVTADDDNANVYELLMLEQFLRKLLMQDGDEKDQSGLVPIFDAEKVRKKIRAMEKLPSNTMRGVDTIRCTQNQVYILANIYGFYAWVNTKMPYYGQKLLMSEDVRDGEIWDYRQLVTDADLFIPRKFGKTYIAGFAMFNGFFSSVDDFEGYCCANAAAQSKLLFKQTVEFIKAVLPKNQTMVRFTATEINWVDGNPYGKKGSINLLSAGGKAKDGKKASLRCADEFGSAAFVKDHSDMSNLVAVIDSSMGPRREPLRLTTTTAGRINSGPYMIRLDALKVALERGELPMTTFAYILQPDPWELQDVDAMIENKKIYKKVNPHLGVTVQADFYEKEISRAKLDPDYMKEVMTKLFNVWQSDKQKDWISPDKIRSLQVQKRISDLSKDWLCWVGCDFSKGDDLCIMAYNCYNPKSKQFFWDYSAWVAEKQLVQHTNGQLYEQWAKEGWLYISPGSTIDESLVERELERISHHVNVMQIGYDPYDSMQFVNLFNTWMAGKLKGKLFGQALTDYLKSHIVPISQTWGSFNASCQVMWHLVNRDERVLYIADSPLIPFQYSCAVLEEDRMGNVKPVKRSYGTSAKIDMIIGWLEGIIMMERYKQQ